MSFKHLEVNFQTFKSAALLVRNRARANANMNPADKRRQQRAIDLFKKVKTLDVEIKLDRMGVAMAYTNGNGTYTVDLYKDSTTCCTCPDGVSGQLCKHQILLTAIVITRATEEVATTKAVQETINEEEQTQKRWETICDFLHYNGKHTDVLTKGQFWTAYCKCDGFGTTDPEMLAEINDGYDWSQIRDSSEQALADTYEYLVSLPNVQTVLQLN